MKKKLAISIFAIFFLVCVVINVLQNQEHHIAIKPVEIADIPTTFQLLETQFYYQQLTVEEKKIYEEIKELLDQYKSGEIVLEQPINIKSYFHIECSLRYDGINYWYLAFLFPFRSDNTQVIPAIEQYSEEKKIAKLLLIIDSDKFQREAPIIGEEDVTNSKEESIDIYQAMKDTIDYLMDAPVSYYEQVNEEIINNLQQIIDDMPKGLNQEEAVKYFSQWLVDHMVYDRSIAKYIMTGNLVGYDFRKQISGGSITSINDRTGTCTGFSMILTTLCNWIGIEAYIVLGDTPNGRHGWVAVKIGDETYYKDPTSEIENQEVKPLQTEIQFYQYFHKTYKPFSDLFQY